VQDKGAVPFFLDNRELATVQGKTVLITGADGGIGTETTKAIAEKGATIIMACIDKAAAEPLCQAIKEESGNPNIEVMHIDLASLASIRQFVKEFSDKYKQLHVLINNAGIFSMNRGETQHGFERTMGINYLGPFLLTNLLLPLLKQTPEARILNVSSNAYPQGKIDLDDLHFKKKYQGFRAYGTSKLAIVLFTQELAERLKDTGVTVNALHPGHAGTDIWNMWPEGKWYQTMISNLMKRLMGSPKDAAQTSIYLASSEDVKGVTGKYFDNKKPKEVSPKCKDIQLQKALWEVSEKLTGLA
jgi:NAD(P)-dependent dehydrogenase (short-subunit alcohol dehydrogenase family)